MKESDIGIEDVKRGCGCGGCLLLPFHLARHMPDIIRSLRYDMSLTQEGSRARAVALSNLAVEHFLNERLPFGVAVSNAVCARLGIPVPDRSKNNDNL